MLEAYIRQRRQERPILLMTHIVLGYPSFEASRTMIAAMVDAGVDLIELQIPFSEPMADGPVILRANQEALARGATVEQCFAFAREVAAAYPIPFVFMTYCNLVYRPGVDVFARRMKAAGLRGAIVPDLPPEEGADYLAAMAHEGLEPIFIFSPNTSDARLRQVAGHARGFVYCVARKGVTGAATEFSQDLEAYLARCRAATSLPLALGFGVKHRGDVEFLTGKVDVAIIGSQTIQVLDEQGVDAVGPFIASLRDA